MGENSKITWTDHTFNPWIGCTKVSDGCTNCYAENLMDKRYGRVNWGKGNPRKRTSPSNWKQPIKWNKQAEKGGVRRRVFCASLADVFDAEVPDPWRDDLFDLIWQTPNLDWLLLTKRPDQVQRYTSDKYRPGWWTHAENNRRTLADWPNVWLGVSAEDQKTADERIPILLSTPAAVRWISAEPLLGPIDFTRIAVAPAKNPWPEDPTHASALFDHAGFTERLDWIIVGGESGLHARPMDPDWAREIRDQCVTAGVPFHFKQWGEWAMAPQEAGTLIMPKKGMAMYEFPMPGGSIVWKMGKKVAGRKLDGKIWDEFPESPLKVKA